MKRLMRLAVVPLALGLMWLAMPPASAAYATAPDAGWYPNNGITYALARDGNVVYIGGGFTALRNSTTNQTVTRNRLAAFDATTGDLLPWNPGASDLVRALSVGPDGTIYAGGDFTQAAGSANDHLAAITPAGADVASFTASANNTVRQIQATASGVYVSGNFARVDNVSQNALALLDSTTGARITAFDAHVTSGKVRAMTLDGNTLYVGGTFGALSGQARSYAGAVDATTGAPTSWAPTAICDGCQVLDMANDGGHVFASVGGPGGGRAISWEKSDATRDWQQHADGDCQAIDVAGGLVYVAGHFGPNFDNQTRHELAVLNEANGDLQSYSLPFTGNDHPGLWVVRADPEGLRIGGGGTALVGSSVRRYAVFPTI